MPQVGSLYTSLTLESKSFVVGLKKAADQAGASAANIEKSFNSLKTAAQAVASALALDAVVAAASRALDYASSLGEVSQQLGVTTKDLQVYRFAASQVGIEQEAMDKALAKLTRTMGEARDGAKGPADAFKELGKLIGRDIVAESRSAGDAIPLIADALSKIEDPARRARLEVDLFGKSGQQLDTLLAGGRGQIDELRGAAERLGIVLSDKLINQADEAADKMGLLKKVLEAKLASVVAENAGAINALGDSLIGLVGRISNAINAWNMFRARMSLAVADKIDNSVFGFLPESIKGTGAARAAAGKLYYDALDSQWQNSIARLGLYMPQARPQPAPGFGGVGSGKGTAKRKAGSKAEDPFAHFVQQARDAVGAIKGVDTRDFESPLLQLDAATSKALQQLKDQFSIDIVLRGDKLPELVAEANQAYDRMAAYREEADRELAEKRKALEEDTTRSLATIYQDLFTGGTKAVWRDFKAIGLQVIAELLAKFTLAKIAGKSFDLGGALGGALKSAGFGGFFAEGGSPPVGKVSVVGERGPELFVPKVPGTIIPNRALRGGGAPSVSLTVNAPGATAETVMMIRRELANAAPVLIQAAQRTTVSALNRPRL